VIVTSEHLQKQGAIDNGRLAKEPHGCPFCSLPKERIEAETSHFVLIRPLVPIVTAEVLVISRRHVPALSLLNQSERNEVDAIWQLILGSVQHHQCGIAFEHGNHSHGPLEPWHEHAHLHLLAAPVKISSLCSTLTQEKHFNDFGSCTRLTKEYIFCKDFGSQPTFFVLSEPLPKQFLKSRCQELLGSVPEYSDEAFWRVAEKCINAAIGQLPSLLRVGKHKAKEEER
jgi:diadenosine tetraphosphate (Ap4A) HIT family hydrolase